MNSFDVEQGLKTIMCKVLNSQNINIDDNYFLSGGNSTNFCIFKDKAENFLGISINWDQFILKGSNIQSLLLQVKHLSNCALNLKKNIFVAPMITGQLVVYSELARQQNLIGMSLDTELSFYSFHTSYRKIAKSVHSYFTKNKCNVILGFSSGGSVALELAQLVNSEQTILVLIEPYWAGGNRIKNYLRLCREILFPIMPNIKIGHLLRLRIHKSAADIFWNFKDFKSTAVLLVYGKEFPIRSLKKLRETYGKNLTELYIPVCHGELVQGSAEKEISNAVSELLNSHQMLQARGLQ